MRRLVGPIALIMVSFNAEAADFPLKATASAPPDGATLNWSGFYLGAYGGGGWGPVTTTSSHLINLPPVSTPPNLFNLSGPVGGARAGYNRVIQSFIFGAEVDLSASDVQHEGINTPGNVGLSRVNWLSTARVRMGYVFGNTMLYGTGGLAVAGLVHERTQLAGGTGGIVNVPPGTVETSSGVFDSWTIGGGAEIKLSSHWSVTAEYLYLPLKPEFTTPITGIVTDYAWQLHTARLGANWSFGP